MGNSILLLEDSPPLRYAMGTVLENAGFKVHRTSSAGEALALILRQHFNMIILDLCLLQEEGDELLQEIRCKSMNARVSVLLLGTEERAWGKKWEKGGENELKYSFLQKPFMPRELIDKVRCCLIA